MDGANIDFVIANRFGIVLNLNSASLNRSLKLVSLNYASCKSLREKDMLYLVSVGTDNLERSVVFYDAVLSIIGMVRHEQGELEAGYGAPDQDPVFFVNLPYNNEAATCGNGVQFTFSAKDRKTVDLFHAKVLELGGSDEGAPGERDYSAGYYGAYCRDEYGNKLHIAHVPD